MSEKSITRAIQAWLKKQPDVWFFKVHGGPHQTAGIPDLIVSSRGRFIALEVKQERRYATVLQKRTIEKIVEAGGVAAVVRSVADVQEVFDGLSASES